MSAERIPIPPTSPTPERPRLVLTEHAPDKTVQRRQDSDRLFALCFVPALGLVALACVGLGLADLDHATTPADRAKPMRLELYHPAAPVVRKPQTPPRLRPILSPRPRPTVKPPLHHFTPRVVPSPPTPTPALVLHSTPQPRSMPMPRVPQTVHVVRLPTALPPTALPPTPTLHPTVPRMPRPAPPVQTAPPAMSSGRTPSMPRTTRSGHSGPAFSGTTTAPVNVPLTTGGSGLQPTAPTQFAPDPTPAPKPIEAPRAEQPKPKPAEAPKPKPVEQPKPAHYVGSVDSREASVDDGSIQTPDADGIDTSSLNGSCVISFEVDESGHLSSVKVKKSCGSPEMDQRCADAVRHGRGIPAVQDHIAYRARGQYTFSL